MRLWQLRLLRIFSTFYLCKLIYSDYKSINKIMNDYTIYLLWWINNIYHDYAITSIDKLILFNSIDSRLTWPSDKWKLLIQYSCLIAVFQAILYSQNNYNVICLLHIHVALFHSIQPPYFFIINIHIQSWITVLLSYMWLFFLCHIYVY